MDNQQKRSVRIGPEFFAKIANDYRDFRWSWPREIMQNSMDCGSDAISATVVTVDGHTVVTVANNGPPMTHQVLTEKLLTLGGSGKNCENAVGGFGVAKSLLYYMNREYRICTGNLLVEGCGAEYTITETPDTLKGTESRVVFNSNITDNLITNFRLFITLSQWRGTFTLNGAIIDERLKKGTGRRNLGTTNTNDEGWGRVYTNKDVPETAMNQVVVRIGGMPMFVRYTNYTGAVILELKGHSFDVLQSNRDSLKYDYASELNTFCEDLVMNKRKALVDTRPITERIKFDGYKLNGKLAKTPYLEVALKEQGLIPGSATMNAAMATSSSATIEFGGKSYGADTPQGHVAAALISLVKVTADPTSETYAAARGSENFHRRIVDIPLRPEFMIRNETGLKVPTYYTPDNFSQYSKGLIWRWMGILATLADIYGTTRPFSVGFIFTEEETLAQHEVVGDECTIYIRAADVVRNPGKAPVMKSRWSLTGGKIWDLVSVAAHEFCHHHWGLSTHDEEYSSRLTDVLAVCMRERSRLAKTFQTRVEWPDAEPRDNHVQITNA